MTDRGAERLLEAYYESVQPSWRAAIGPVATGLVLGVVIVLATAEAYRIASAIEQGEGRERPRYVTSTEGR